MTNLVLTFNAKATEAMGANTRLRVKPMKRGGVEYVALRPSYRVSGKNAMIRVNKGDDGNMTAELPEELITELTLPALKSNHTAYKFDDVGYGWFLLKGDEELNERKDAIVTISKARKSGKKAATATEGAEDTGGAEEAGEAGSEEATPQVTAEAVASAEPETAAPKKAAAKKGGKKADKKAPWDKEQGTAEPTEEQPAAPAAEQQQASSEGDTVTE